MPTLEKNLRNDLTNHLNKLEDVDYEDDDAPDSSLPEDLLLAAPQNEQKIRLYRNENFKQFLRDYLLKKHKITKEKITNRYSEKVYRSMYFKNVVTNKTLNLYTKVLYHPDVTEADYEYIQTRTARFPKYVLYNQVGCFMLALFAFYKTNLGSKVRTNPVLGAITLGVTPMIALIGTQKLNGFLLDRKLRQIGLPKKYGIRW